VSRVPPSSAARSRIDSKPIPHGLVAVIPTPSSSTSTEIISRERVIRTAHAEGRAQCHDSALPGSARASSPGSACRCRTPGRNRWGRLGPQHFSGSSESRLLSHTAMLICRPSPASRLMVPQPASGGVAAGDARAGIGPRSPGVERGGAGPSVGSRPEHDTGGGRRGRPPLAVTLALLTSGDFRPTTNADVLSSARIRRETAARRPRRPGTTRRRPGL
jgi:hypothetical protein